MTEVIAPYTADALQADPKVAPIVKVGTRLLEQAKALILAPETEAGAADLAGQIAGASRLAEEARTFFVKPLNDQVKRINDLFRTLTAPITEANQLVRDKLEVWSRQKRETAEKARIAAQAAVVAATHGQGSGEQAAGAVRAAQVETRPIVGIGTGTRIGTRTEWTWEVENLGQIPRDYLCLDEGAVRAAIKAGAREIPGLRIFEKDVTVIRQRRN